MGRSTTRTHVVMPTELVSEIDRRVGPRHRSEFVVRAVAEKLARIRLLETAERAAGSLASDDIPGWETSESASAWVRSLRAADARRLEEQQTPS